METARHAPCALDQAHSRQPVLNLKMAGESALAGLTDLRKRNTFAVVPGWKEIAETSEFIEGDEFGKNLHGRDMSYAGCISAR